MLGAEDAMDAVRLQYEFDDGPDRFEFCHDAIIDPEAPPRIRSTPEPDPDS